MNGTAKKVLALALLLYAGSIASLLIDQRQPPSDVFVAEGTWTVRTYLTCALFIAAVGLTIAAAKLRN